MITGNLAHLERLAGQLTGPVKKALELLKISLPASMSMKRNRQRTAGRRNTSSTSISRS